MNQITKRLSKRWSMVFSNHIDEDDYLEGSTVPERCSSTGTLRTGTGKATTSKGKGAGGQDSCTRGSDGLPKHVPWRYLHVKSMPRNVSSHTI